MSKLDPWLYPGCICEVWNNDDERQLRYFYKILEDGNFCFVKSIGAKEEVFDHYVPVGTPWDYAPKSANYIQIDSIGSCLFSAVNGNMYYHNSIRFCGAPVSFIWINCPEHLKRNILPRPEWAK